MAETSSSDSDGEGKGSAEVVQTPSAEFLGDPAVDSDDGDFDEAEKAPPRLPSSYRAKPSVIEFSPVSNQGGSPFHEDKEPIFDPCGLSPRGVLSKGVPGIIESLKFDAVELHVEGFDTTRLEIFGPAECFAALLSEGSEPGTWEVTEKSENVRCSEHIRLLKKFRLRAATEVDRSEKVMIAFFDSNTPPHLLQPSHALGYEIFSVGELIESKELALERSLRSDGGSFWGDAYVLLSLDFVKHVSKQETISIDFGVDDDAPRMNRMFFVISRSLPHGTWSPVYKSEVRTRSEADKFDPVSVPCQDFHAGDESKNFRLELHRWYKNGRTRPLGFMQTSVHKLKSVESNSSMYWWPAEDGISSAKITVLQALTSPCEARFHLLLSSS
ncbi:hypothetical protein FGB62_31g12 [Gracilaria domingensis]|nr:hypothetical protein FGB62_31g12 [Gracilaria domingensis]